MNNEQQGRVILLAAQKGGVNKTSTIINMSSVSHGEGNKRLVVVDLDAQRSTIKWDTKFRTTETLKSVDAYFPAVTEVPEGITLETFIEFLRPKFDEIYLDTAGYIGDKTGEAKRILEEAIPLADFIITPVRVGRFDVDSAFETMEFINDVLEESGKTDVTRVLLASDVRGRDKSMNYLKEELLAERMDEFKDTWTLLESYIPSSTIVAKNIDKGGSAFIPQRVNQVITATVMAYREMLNVGGIKSREQSEKEILASVTKELAKLKRAAKKAVAEVEETED
ncbi:ParA family protein [Acinetobacter radioresistens]|uniref:ParA family protein n=1 Tax=Acinetobacter radioresistens TaxID=40216 RepID=UPI002002AA01|nr:ParA family protein [Acinetobacter radioresistens]MCK4083733.1 ParA family protein [Acinetobacter radioresistens]